MFSHQSIVHPQRPSYMFNLRAVSAVRSWLRISIGVATIVCFGWLSAAELSVKEVRHAVACPDPGESACIMKRPIKTNEYTFVSKPVDIEEGNGVWIVRFSKSSSGANMPTQKMHLLDFYGVPHVVTVTFSSPSKSSLEIDPVDTKSRGKTVVKSVAVKGVVREELELPSDNKTSTHINFKVNSSKNPK